MPQQEIACVKAKGLYSQSEEDEHNKQIVFDTMYKTQWSFLKFCILRSIMLKQFRKSVGLCQAFLQVPKGLIDKTISSSKTIV